MAFTHLRVCRGVCRAFGLLKRDCHRVRASPWGDQWSFLSANTNLELSREFWKVFQDFLSLQELSAFLTNCSLLWFLENDPFCLLNVRLPTIPLLPSLTDSCMPSIAHGLLWASAIFVCMFDPSGYTKVTRAPGNTHTTASKGSLRRVSPSVHT